MGISSLSDNRDRRDHVAVGTGTRHHVVQKLTPRDDEDEEMAEIWSHERCGHGGLTH